MLTPYYTTWMHLVRSLAIFGAFYPNKALSVLWLALDQCLSAGSLSELSKHRKSDTNSCDRGQVSSETLKTQAELSYLAVPGWFRQKVSVLTSLPRALTYWLLLYPLSSITKWNPGKAPQSTLSQALSHESPLVYIKTAGSCRVLWGD